MGFNQKFIISCFILNVIILLPLCWATVNNDMTHEQSPFVKGQNQVLQKAIGDIVERRKREANDQVVKIQFDLKDDKSKAALTQQEKDYLLLVHNAYRSAVQPFAANMMELVWDDDIAGFAQEWADECAAAHRPNRNFMEWINMGENIFWQLGGRYHEGMSAKFWWDEVQWFDFTTLGCEPGQMCGHYITMVWASSTRMGCGVKRCHRLRELPNLERESYYFVCNYNGRFVSDTPPYVEHSTMCSYCYQTEYPKCRYNLCVTEDMLDYDIGYNGSTKEIGFNRTFTFSSKKSPTTPATTSSPPSPTTIEPQDSTPTTQKTTSDPFIVDVATKVLESGSSLTALVYVQLSVILPTCVAICYIIR